MTHSTRTLLITLFLVAQQGLMAQNDFLPAEIIVSASALKLRENASTTAKALETIPRGTTLKVLGTHNDGEVVEVDERYAPWYRVQTTAGKIGYVFGGYVASTWELFYEDDILQGDLPPLNWYAVYARDTFSDELRAIELRVEKVYQEMFDAEVDVVRTNQTTPSKFIIGTTGTLKTGYVGPLGLMDSPGWFFEGGLNPGAMQPISSGLAPGDTIVGETFFLAATGCAELKDNFVQVNNYQLTLFEILPEVTGRAQSLTQWVSPEPGLNPNVNLHWYGDLDGDRLPDALIYDCPVEMGCRASLFLSTKAQPGELIKKVCEHFWYGD
jgi:Bacterial SH3 domain